MSDLISRQDAIDAICTWDKFGVDERGRVVRWYEGLEPYVHLRDVVWAIEKMPSAGADMSSFCDRLWKKAYDRGRAEALADVPDKNVGKWIPCSERLPEPNATEIDGYHYDAYLVTNGHMMYTARYDGMYWILWGQGIILNYIKAWMPLPEPYREEQL